MTSPTDTGPAKDSGMDDPRPSVRIAAWLRRAITAGAIPPGTRLDQSDIAPRFGAPAQTAIHAFNVLKRERLVYYDRTWYAAPAGPPTDVVNARLGNTLTRLLRETGKTARELADATPRQNRYAWVFESDVIEAQTGSWQNRYFWQACDTALNAEGTLLRLHDTSYAPASDSPPPVPSQDLVADGWLPPRPPGRVAGVVARVAAEIAARVAAGDYPPGTLLPYQHVLGDEHGTSAATVGHALAELAGQGVLLRTDFGYCVPGPLPFQAPAPITRTLTGIVLHWDDGTRTRLACTPDAASGEAV